MTRRNPCASGSSSFAIATERFTSIVICVTSGSSFIVMRRRARPRETR